MRGLIPVKIQVKLYTGNSWESQVQWISAQVGLCVESLLLGGLPADWLVPERLPVVKKAAASSKKVSILTGLQVRAVGWYLQGRGLFAGCRVQV